MSKTYIFEKDGMYLKDDGTFTANITEAKEIKLKWWEWLFKVLIEILKIYQSGNLILKK